MKKILIGLLVSFFYFYGNLNVIAYENSVSKEEQSIILEEAEDWIDDMPEGLQNRLSDAVAHSMHGFYSEIMSFRSIAPADSVSYPIVKTKDISSSAAEEIKLRYYFTPENENKESIPLLIYFHGGGWTMGSISVTDNFCRALAATNKVNIVSVEYPLAPEIASSAILKKSAQTVKSILKENRSHEISLGGDGAGGNLALSIFFYLNETKEAEGIKSLVLYYPLLTLHPDMKAETWRKFGRGYGLDARVMEAYTEAYLGSESSIDSKINFSPLEATDEEIKKLPPVLIISAGRDIIIEDVHEFTARLKKSGVDVKDVEFSGAIHGFITDRHQNTAFKKSVELTSRFLEAR